MNIKLFKSEQIYYEPTILGGKILTDLQGYSTGIWMGLMNQMSNWCKYFVGLSHLSFFFEPPEKEKKKKKKPKKKNKKKKNR